jgi:hypothetical protein
MAEMHAKTVRQLAGRKGQTGGREAEAVVGSWRGS